LEGRLQKQLHRHVETASLDEGLGAMLRRLCLEQVHKRGTRLLEHGLCVMRAMRGRGQAVQYLTEPLRKPTGVFAFTAQFDFHGRQLGAQNRHLVWPDVPAGCFVRIPFGHVGDAIRDAHVHCRTDPSSSPKKNHGRFCR
jgi:hypothetical protein